jgi:hypothetical protein
MVQRLLPASSFFNFSIISLSSDSAVSIFAERDARIFAFEVDADLIDRIVSIVEMFEKVFDRCVTRVA